MSPVFHIGDYGTEIHEQTEMPVNCWGQYAHNNQPTHHILYMFGATGCAAKGQYWIRQALSTLYSPDSDMFPGDEDNGEMRSAFLIKLYLYS